MNRLNRYLEALREMVSFRQVIACCCCGWLMMVSMLGFQQASWADGLNEMMPPVEQVTGQAAEQVTEQAVSADLEISSEKLEQFAQTYVQVLRLLSDREPELAAAETSDAAAAVYRSKACSG